MKVDLNSDLGEGFGPWSMGDDNAMLDIVTTANVACGFHAGDPVIMHATAAEAKRKNVAIGAHPGFNDLWGFGRRVIKGDSAADIEKMVAYQIGAFQAMATLAGHRMTHVKTHGALANMAAEDDDLALAIGRAIKAIDRDLIYMAMPGMATERAARKLDLPFALEAYADRTYDDTFNLTSRRVPGSVIHDPEEAATHVLRMIEDRAIRSVSGKRLDVTIDTICVHGDTPSAVTMAKVIRERLEAAGVTIAAFAKR
ncbi:LamB/YcsF family protein [Microvirga sp. 2MCAF38]|uniref:LamB/YcsF family protein n=1 Tax=Microvirga sp. 2MCAF38 TaxID=3232989 RepID=UPI003F9510ED